MSSTFYIALVVSAQRLSFLCNWADRKYWISIGYVNCQNCQIVGRKTAIYLDSKLATYRAMIAVTRCSKFNMLWQDLVITIW